MSTNIETEHAIRRRLGTYPPGAADDIRWLFAETARLRDAAADECKQRVIADESSARALLGKTDAQVHVRELGAIVRAQNAETLASRQRADRLAERITAALDPLHPVAAVEDLRTHDAHCHQTHAGCLAARTIATLTGEEPDRG